MSLRSRVAKLEAQRGTIAEVSYEQYDQALELLGQYRAMLHIDELEAEARQREAEGNCLWNYNSTEFLGWFRVLTKEWAEAGRFDVKTVDRAERIVADYCRQVGRDVSEELKHGENCCVSHYQSVDHLAVADRVPYDKWFETAERQGTSNAMYMQAIQMLRQQVEAVRKVKQTLRDADATLCDRCGAYHIGGKTFARPRPRYLGQADGIVDREATNGK